MDIVTIAIIAIALPVCAFILWDAKKDKEKLALMGRR